MKSSTVHRARCPECGSGRAVHANGTVERHTRKVKGRKGRRRCTGSGRKAAR